jgi:putative heme transporter
MAEETTPKNQSGALPEKTVTAPLVPSPAAAEALKRGPEAVRRSMPMGLSVALGILLAALLGWFFHYLVTFLLIVYLSFVAATIMEAPVQWLMRLRLRRGYAAVIVMVGTLALVLGALALIANGVYNQVQSVSTNLQKAPDHVNAFVNDLKRHFPGIGQQLGDFNLGSEIAKGLPSFATLWSNAMAGVEVLSWLVIMFFVVLYMLIDGADHLKALRVLIPRGRRLDATRLFQDLAKAHRGWAVASLANVASASILAAAGLLMLRIPGAILLGFIAGLGELIPTLGSVIGAAVALLFTLVVKPEMFVWVLLMFIVVDTVQGYTISPHLLKFSVKLPVLVTILSIVVFGLLFGFLGILVSIPIVADLVVIWSWVNQRLEKDTENYDVVNLPPGGRQALTVPANAPPARAWRFGRIFGARRPRPNTAEEAQSDGRIPRERPEERNEEGRMTKEESGPKDPMLK